MHPAKLSKLFHLAYPAIQKLPLDWQVKLMSYGRMKFMKDLCDYIPKAQFIPHNDYAVNAWGLKFRSPLMNSAGMFKNGEAYDAVAKLGAGGYIGGTSTANARSGNAKNGITLPFITLPNSDVAVNWLGLPNLGDDVLSQKNITFNKVDGCPIGWSVMRSPDYDEAVGLQLLIDSLWKYHNHSQIDFIEINESCPNIKAGGGNIVARLQVIADKFLSKRERKLPVVVKLSNDITVSSLEEILTALVKLGFDGINLGNTSTNYTDLINKIANDNESKLFDYFVNNYSGGISGKLLKDSSLNLCAHTAEVLANINPGYEFHIIRSGGVESFADVKASLENGATLVQWYTGFFTAYNLHQDKVYANIFAK